MRMLFCPKCGHRAKKGEFCPDCGIRLEILVETGAQKPTGPTARPQAPAVAAKQESGISHFTMDTKHFVMVLAGLFLLLIAIGLVVFLLLPKTVPTQVQITAPLETMANANTPVTIKLVDSSGNPVAGKRITISNGGNVTVTTNSKGIAETVLIFGDAGSHSIKAVFGGDDAYADSSGEQYIAVSAEACTDGTAIEKCSGYSKGYFCDANKTLVWSCSACGCGPDLICYDNYCLTEEEKDEYMIHKLQKSIVHMAHTYATGSGVIIAQGTDYGTLILTAKHVIADALDVEDVRVTTSEGQTIPASAILVAPYDMDLAVVYLLGTHGEYVSVNTSESYYKGQEVMALGSPLGIQGSVSKGIISNFLSTQTESGYTYTVIQTDAALNPGNSGGGLFLKKNGNLIGINTFILASEYGAEGMGFAIDVGTINKLPPLETWNVWEPTPKCSDGTPYGVCSLSNIGKYCSKGYLWDDCGTCGCPKGYWCPESGTCFTCPAGYTGFQTYAGEGYCCPQGWKFYDDGANEQFCCPPGTTGYQGGYCE